MKLLDIIDYDTVNYKLPSVLISFPYCSMKCGIENCQNRELLNAQTYDVSAADILDIYRENPLTKSLVCSGLEPLDSFPDLLEIITEFRKEFGNEPPIVIYSGYYECEISEKIHILNDNFKNIIIKLGRYKPNRPSIYNETLGVTLASDNQHTLVLDRREDL